MNIQASQGPDADLIEQTAQIVSAYVGNNSVPPQGIALLIHEVFGALSKLGSQVEPEAKPAALTPAVPVKKSVSSDYITCLEDGKKFKSLKRHLRTGYNLSPEDYRAKWGLPADYPMVAPAYAAKRSALAKGIGLGSMRKKK